MFFITYLNPMFNIYLTSDFFPYTGLEHSSDDGKIQSYQVSISCNSSCWYKESSTGASFTWGIGKVSSMSCECSHLDLYSFSIKLSKGMLKSGMDKRNKLGKGRFIFSSLIETYGITSDLN